jgi:MtaA/CmuA family methyltransferase
MNKRDKFLNFLNAEPGEHQVPFQPILMHFAARYNNKTYGEFASDYKVLVDSNIRCMEDFDLDWVELISDPYREASAFGAAIEYIPEGVPKCLNLVVSSPEDIKSLKIPDVHKSERTLDRIKGAAYYQKLLKGSVPVFGWVEGPLASACDLAGVSEMLIMLMMDSDSSQFLMDKCMITAKAFAKAQVEEGCDVIGIGDAICSQIDLDIYNSFVKERHKELVSYIQSIGGKVKMHICGNITHLLPSMAELKLDILDIDWQVDFDEAYRHVGPEVAICGNTNPIIIQDASESEVTRLSRDLVQTQHGRKFIYSGGCEITVNTPHKNLMAMGLAVK